jgi:hypothetical protein
MSDQDLNNNINDRAPPSNGTATSDAAAESVKPSTCSQRAMLVVAHLNAGAAGLTEREGCQRTGLEPNTYRPRRWELAKAGLLVDSGTTRPSKPNSKHQAAVWVHKDFAPAPAKDTGGAS